MYHSTESNITDIYLYKVQLNKVEKINEMQLWANAEWCIHLEKQFFGLETGQSHHRQHQLKVGNALLAFLKTTKCANNRQWQSESGKEEVLPLR